MCTEHMSQANMASALETLQDVTFTTWLAVILGLLVFFCWRGIQKYYSLLGNSPLPGPKPLPWIGNLLDVFRYGGLHKMFLTFFYKYGRAHKLCLGRSPMIVVSDPEMIREILVKEFSSFPNRLGFTPRPPLDSGLFVSRGESWKRVRTTLTPTFTASKLKQIVPIIEEKSDLLLNKMQRFSETGESVDVVRIFSLFALDVIMKAAFGIESNVQVKPDPVFVEKARRVFQSPIWIRFFSVLPFWEYFSKYYNPLQNVDYFIGIQKQVLEQRQKQGSTSTRDLVQLMLEAHEETDVDGVSKLSDDEVTAQSVTFLFAGFETTGTTLTMTAYHLATHPEIQDRLIEEIDEIMDSRGDRSLYEVVQRATYLDQVISEVLRISGPAFFLNRECTEDTTIKGVKIPKGVDVAIPTYVLHRDPEVWENPEEFNPDNFSPEAKQNRSPYSYLPFGAGPRQCMGMRLALLEIKQGLCKILRRFKFERAPETVPTVEHTAVLILSPKKTIYVKIKAR